jgi:hypothetical protein
MESGAISRFQPRSRSSASREAASSGAVSSRSGRRSSACPEARSSWRAAVSSTDHRGFASIAARMRFAR